MPIRMPFQRPSSRETTAALIQRVDAAEREARETKEAFAELTRVVASAMMPGAPVPSLSPSGRLPLFAFDRPYTYSTPQPPSRRPDSYFTVEDLRGLASRYDVLRACIQHLKREIAAVPIQVAARDPKTTGVEDRIAKATEWFAQTGGCGGKGKRRSHFEGAIVEDLATVGAAAVFYAPARSGMPFEAYAIDAATIRPRIDAFGWPGPGDEVFEQWVYGVQIRGFTAEELCYDGLYPVSYTPYFSSPVEWLVSTIFTALKSDEWNRSWLTEGTTVSDVFAAPENWKPEDIERFSRWWTAMLSGNLPDRQKTRFVPAGTSRLMTPSRKDQDFQAFDQWLMQRCCSIMGVAPSAIGFAEKQYKVSQEGAMDQTTAFGAGAILEFRKAIYDDMLARLGYPDLECKNVAGGEEDESSRVDRLTKACGAPFLTINEARKEAGLDPLDDDANVLLVPTTLHPLEMAHEPQEAPPVPGSPPPAGLEGASDTTEEDMPSDASRSYGPLVTALAKWERKALNRLRDGKSADCAFHDPTLSAEMTEEIRRSLVGCRDEDGVRWVFRGACNGFVVHGSSWERKHAGYLWRARRLAQERAEIHA